jgi:hypothetical protein
MENTVPSEVPNVNLPPQDLPPIKSSSPLPIIILSLFMIICMSAIGYLFWQNQQLLNRLTQVSDKGQNPVIQNIPTATDTMANWQNYTNPKLGISIKYPGNLFFSDTDNYITLAFVPIPTLGDGQGAPYDAMNIYSDSNQIFRFNILKQMQAGETKTGIEMHDAGGEVFTKIKNLQFGTYDAVEYIQDGVTQSEGSNRGYIPYAHRILIRKNDNDFISLVNQSEIPDKVREHDVVFNQIVSAFKFIGN